jgi:hypothetical protein
MPVTPAASWAAQPSVMPAVTLVPAGRPVSSDAASQTRPSVVPGATTGGSTSGGTARASSTCQGQSSSVRSKPDFSAWLLSVGVACPVSRRFT